MQMTLCFLQRASEHQRDSWKAVRNILKRSWNSQSTERKAVLSACLQSEILSFLALHWEGTETVSTFSVHPKSWKKFKSRLKELSSRKSVQSIKPSLEKIRVYARGWLNYYGIASMKNNMEDINGWLYHRIRMCIWNSGNFQEQRKEI